MSAIARLFNYTIDVLGRVIGPDEPMENDEENHPVEEETSPEVLATTRGTVQERSARERASLVNVGAVASTHRVYMRTPRSGSGDLVTVDESRTLHVEELDLDLTIVFVRDGGGRGDHLEIDATEYRP